MKITTTPNPQTGQAFTTVQVSTMNTKGNILDIRDSVDYSGMPEREVPFEKVTICLTSYGENKESLFFKHYMDLDDFLLLAYDIVNKSQVNYEEYKGSKSSKYKSGWEARVMKVSSWAEYGKGQGAYVFSFETGPGQQGDKGQVSPIKGEQTVATKAAIGLPEARRAFLYALNYFNNKQSAFLSKLEMPGSGKATE